MIIKNKRGIIYKSLLVALFIFAPFILLTDTLTLILHSKKIFQKGVSLSDEHSFFIYSFKSNHAYNENLESDIFSDLIKETLLSKAPKSWVFNTKNNQIIAYCTQHQKEDITKALQLFKGESSYFVNKSHKMIRCILNNFSTPRHSFYTHDFLSCIISLHPNLETEYKKGLFYLTFISKNQYIVFGTEESITLTQHFFEGITNPSPTPKKNGKSYHKNYDISNLIPLWGDNILSFAIDEIPGNWYSGNPEICIFYIREVNETTLLVVKNNLNILDKLDQLFENLKQKEKETIPLYESVTLSKKIYKVNDLITDPKSHEGSLAHFYGPTDSYDIDSTAIDMLFYWITDPIHDLQAENSTIYYLSPNYLHVSGNHLLHQQTKQVLNHLRNPNDPITIKPFTYKAFSNKRAFPQFIQLSDSWVNLLDNSNRKKYFKLNNIYDFEALSELVYHFDFETGADFDDENDSLMSSWMWTIFESSLIIRHKTDDFQLLYNYYRCFLEGSKEWLPIFKNLSVRSFELKKLNAKQKETFFKRLKQLEQQYLNQFYYCFNEKGYYFFVSKSDFVDTLSPLLNSHD